MQTVVAAGFRHRARSTVALDRDCVEPASEAPVAPEPVEPLLVQAVGRSPVAGSHINNWSFVPALLAGSGLLLAGATSQWSTHPDLAVGWRAAVSQLRRCPPVPLSRFSSVLKRFQHRSVRLGQPCRPPPLCFFLRSTRAAVAVCSAGGGRLRAPSLPASAQEASFPWRMCCFWRVCVGWGCVQALALHPSRRHSAISRRCRSDHLRLLMARSPWSSQDRPAVRAGPKNS